MPDDTQEKEQPVEPESQAASPEDYKEKWQRALAELENLRKRQEQEKAQFVKFNLEGFLEELLPVVDNFYRATEHIPAEQRQTPWVTGITYIQKNLLDVLERRGVREIAVKPGDPFDSLRHQAIETVESAEVPEDHVVEVKNRGYMLHDRVLRPTYVSVSKPAQ